MIHEAYQQTMKCTHNILIAKASKGKRFRENIKGILQEIGIKTVLV